MNRPKITSTILYHAGSEWAPWNGDHTCPECGGTDIEYNTVMMLASNPPQSKLRCKGCGHHFASGINVEQTYNDMINKFLQHDQSILGIPQVGDWPPCDPPYYPIDTTLNVGWICPKCGRALAPHVNSCPHCNEPTTINITY